MRSFTSRPSAGLFYLVISGLLWGTGGLTGSLLGRVAGLSAIAVAACRLTAGGVLIVCYLTAARKTWPSGRAAWARITVIGLLAAIFQSCYFAAVSLTSVPLATLITIGAAPVIVLGAERAIGRPAGRLALLDPLTGAILAALLLGERLSATGIVGAAIIGAAVILTVQADRGGGRVGGDDGDDAQPRLHRQRLAQDQQADQRGQHRV